MLVKQFEKKISFRFNKFYMFISTSSYSLDYTVKPVLSGHSKIDKTKILMTKGSLMKVESIAECSLGAFCNTLACIKL